MVEPTPSPRFRKPLVLGIFGLLGLGALFLGASSLRDRRFEKAFNAQTTVAPSPSSPTTTLIVLEPKAAQETKEPSGINLAELNRYWQQRINDLRKEKQLSSLAVDERLIATANEWALSMRMRNEISHIRLDGKTMHQWIDTKQLAFTERNAPGGWRTNYFVENISRVYAEPTTESLKKALDKILVDYFLSEGPGGDHYESIYHPDWNSVGLGYSYDPTVTKSVRVYFVFHYGSLKTAP